MALSRPPRGPLPRPRFYTITWDTKSVLSAACELPSRLGLPLSRLHVPDIRTEVIARGLVASISETTIWRWLSEDAIKPWQHRSWIFPRDPDFERKAGVVLDLYHRTFDGKAWRPTEYVLSADEKTSIQARCRCHPALPPAEARAIRVEHEYARGGALQYFAAWDCHRAKLFGRCEPTTGIEPFGRLVEQVMTAEPYARARRVFWVVDNGSSHRGTASIRRLEGRFKNLRLIHLPLHASWLNRMEIYFSVVQRKVLTPNDFTDLGEVEARVLTFQAHYEQSVQPFEWRFTRDDLTRLMKKLADQETLMTAA
uniref:IS630 family transposase n=1 Tax=Thermorudis sp. TaxID=1969470 RepID=A0A7C3A7T6_9BACT